MQQIVNFSLKQKIFYNLIFVLFSVAGFVALSQIPTERYPNVNFGEVTVTTYFPGASPQEVETLVTKKIEDILESVGNIEWIKSISMPERSNIRIKFIDDSDYKELYDEVRFKLMNIIQELPVEVDPPIIKEMTTGELFPVVIINLGGQQGNRALSLVADELKSSIQKVPGVKEVIVNGEFIREFHIYLDPKKLRSYGISFDEVATKLQEINVSINAGSVSTNTGEYLVKVDEKFHTRKDVVKTIIRHDKRAGLVRLEDLATRASLEYRDPVIISSVNGENVVSLRVTKTEFGNSLKIKEELNDVIKSFSPLFEKENINVTFTQDSTIKIKDGMNTLGWNMLAGIILVSLIIWYFMGFRNACLVTIGIPFSFLIAMLITYLTGYSLNELTFFSFVLVSGIIVDDAIIVNENIYRHIQEGKELYQAIVVGVSEVGMPVISSSLTTIFAFLPMLIMSGSTGDFFAQIPLAVSYALIASLVECLLILPIHYLDYGVSSKKEVSERLSEDNTIIKYCGSITNVVLHHTLKYRKYTVMTVILLLFVSISILFFSATGKISLLKIKFFPDDYLVYFVDVIGQPETPVKEIDKKIKEISKFIIDFGEGNAQSAAGFAGWYLNEDYEFIEGNNFGVVMVTLPEKKLQAYTNSQDHLVMMRQKIKNKFENNDFKLFVHAQKDGPPSGKDINVKILGSNIETINALAKEIVFFLKTEPKISHNLLELEVNKGVQKRVYRFAVLHEKAEEYQLNIGHVANLAGSVLDGRYIGKFRSNDEEVDLKLYLDPELINNPQDALMIPFTEHASQPIILGDIVKLNTQLEESELHRYQGQRAISIKSDLIKESTINPTEVVRYVNEFYDSIRSNYPGATLVFSGEHESTQRSYQSLFYAFLMAILIIYVILATQFQSYTQPIIILSAIAFALIGVVFGKMMTQSLFTVNSFIAVIGVAGVVVNDALMLIDFMNKNYRSGSTRHQAIENAIKVRLRPILLTTLTTTLGLLPMALGIPDYSIVWGSMASTFVTGLATATILTIFIIPVLWDIVQAKQEKNNAKFLDTSLR